MRSLLFPPPRHWPSILISLCCGCLYLYLLETPRRSKIAWLSEWLFLLSLLGIREISTASSMFGSIQQKEFLFPTCNMKPDAVVRRCTIDQDRRPADKRYCSILPWIGRCSRCPLSATSPARRTYKTCLRFWGEGTRGAPSKRSREMRELAFGVKLEMGR